MTVSLLSRRSSNEKNENSCCLAIIIRIWYAVFFILYAHCLASRLSDIQTRRRGKIIDWNQLPELFQSLQIDLKNASITSTLASTSITEVFFLKSDLHNWSNAATREKKQNKRSYRLTWNEWSDCALRLSIVVRSGFKCLVPELFSFTTEVPTVCGTLVDINRYFVVKKTRKHKPEQ